MVPVTVMALLLIGAGSAAAMEPIQISSRTMEAPGHSSVSAAVSQEQASLDVSCRELRAQSASQDQPLLEQGPRHPKTSHVLGVGF